MKIVKTCLPGSKVFEKYPDWLNKVVHQVEKLVKKDLLCAVHKARHEGVMSFFFNCDETQTRIIVRALPDQAKPKAQIIFMQRQAPVYGSTRRPTMGYYDDREHGYLLGFTTKDEIDLIAQAMALHFNSDSPYPLKHEHKTCLTNKLRGWSAPGAARIVLFAGSIDNFSIVGDVAHIDVQATGPSGESTTWRYTTPLSLKKGADLRKGNWLIYSPVDQPYISSRKELDRFFRFVDAEQTQPQLAEQAA